MVGTILSDRFEVGAELLPLIGRQHRLVVGDRLGIVAMDGVRGFADDRHLAAIVLQEVEMRLDRLLLGFDVMGEQVGRVPAGNEDEIVGSELLLQCLRISRHLVALLDAVEADLLAIGEAIVERQMRADRMIVVIAPGDRVGSVADHVVHFLSAEAVASSLSVLALRRPLIRLPPPSPAGGEKGNAAPSGVPLPACGRGLG